MVNFKIETNSELCSGCSTCVFACQVNREIEPICNEGIAPKTNKVLLRIINGHCHVLHPELCKGPELCGLCEELCPNGAIRLVKQM
ncbi:MAG: ATP-binding protein [Candidatus Helarchaeota archaeon]